MDDKSKSQKIFFLVAVGVVAAIIGLTQWLGPNTVEGTKVAIEKLKIATGFTLLTLIALYAFSVLFAIANGTIDLSGLLSENDSDGNSKGASMSRFQLLIFTLVIALSLFLVTIANNLSFPAIPGEILTLLGISGTTYAVSKGIQKADTTAKNDPPPPPPPPAPPVQPGPQQ
jgi:hypothetical protein